MGDGVPTDIERHAKGDDDAAATLEVSSFTAGKHSSRVYYRPAGSSIQTEAGEDEDQRQGDEVQNDDTERPPSKQISRRERRSFLALRVSLGLVHNIQKTTRRIASRRKRPPLMTRRNMRCCIVNQALLLGVCFSRNRTYVTSQITALHV